jgi:hypothetical protein
LASDELVELDSFFGSAFLSGFESAFESDVESDFSEDEPSVLLSDLAAADFFERLSVL